MPLPITGRIALTALAVISIFLLLSGFFGILYGDYYFMSQLEKNLPITSNSPTLKYFKHPPADIFILFRFFNLTNPDDVVSNGSKPVVEEIGPYVYRFQRSKDNMTFNEDETEVFFEQRKYYEFDDELSVGSENDSFINMDLIVYKVSKAAYDGGKIGILAKTLSTFNRTSPFKIHVVKEFLFGGNDDLLAKILSIKYPDADTRPAPRFGILVKKETGYSKNGTLDATFTLNTGKKDISKYKSLIKFNRDERLSMWPNDTGVSPDPNEIRGTLGSGFVPGITAGQALSIYEPELCLSVDLYFIESISIGPIDAFKFMVDSAYLGKTIGDINRAMCSPEDRDKPEKCMQNGVLNTTTCRNSSLMISLPHMMDADDFYQNSVIGMKPDPEKHSIFVDVDPLTGISLKAAKRMQINVRLSRFNHGDFANLPKFTLMPIVWLEETGMVTSDTIKAINDKVHGNYYAIRSTSYCMLLVGFLLLAAAIAIFLYQREFCPSNDQDSCGSTKSASSKRKGEGTRDEKHPLA